MNGAVLSIALAASVAAAQTVADALAASRQSIETQKRVIVSGSLPLTDDEARAFWPLFDAYEAELHDLHSRADRLVAGYVAAYASLTDAQARAMLDEMVSVEEARLRLRQKWIGRMAKALPPRKLARFFQLDNKLEAVVQADLARQIPLVP